MVVRRSVAALLLAGLLVSCSEDDPSSSRHDPPATSATPTPTGSAAPTLPPEAKEDTEAGAKAFVEHWIATLNYAAATGETDALRALATPGCGPCDDMADQIDDVYGAGGYIDSGGWKLDRIERVHARGDAITSLWTLLRLGSQLIDHGDGEPPERNQATSRARGTFDLRRTADGWRLHGFFQGFK